MLRPATPLAVIFLGAFVLLLLSTLSTPIIKAIPLASFNGNTFGVFGYCERGKCSPLGVGYSYSGLTDNSTTHDFSLPTSARHSLSSILIVHPVAAFLTLICFGLSVAAHFHSPAHSPRYLLALLIFTIPTVLASLLAFLVDILVFVPHVQWGGWIVLAATVLIIASMVLTCAMRRTLVSRKARKKRIAENAEMSGENYYTQRAQLDAGMAASDTQQSAMAQLRSVPPPSASFATMSDFPKAESPPPLPSGGGLSPSSDKAADFATFDVDKKNGGDEHMPLSAAGAAPGRGRSGSYSQWRGGAPNDAYGPPPMDRRGDPYGPGGGAAAMGMGQQPLRHQGSANSMGSRGSSRSGRGGGPPPFYGRGRGGYPPMPMPRGGYGAPRGAPYGRGMRGGPMGYGGQMGYPGPGRGGYGPPRGGSMRGPPPNYDPQRGYYGGPPPNGPPSSAGPYGGSTYVDEMPGMRRPSMDNPDMPIGQAVEMDDRNGMPSPTRENFGLRESDVDVQGMIGMQQQRQNEAGRPRSPTSIYSEEPFLPARAGWNPSASEPNSTNSALRTPYTNSSSALAGRALSTIAHSPVPNNGIDHARRPSIAVSDSYYEDIDPSFAARSSSAPPPASRPVIDSTAIPSALMAGGGGGLGPVKPRLQSTSGEHLAPAQTAVLERSSSTSSLTEGARSPAESETSHYTSVSQRPVNPEWPGSAYPPPPPQMQAQYQQQYQQQFSPQQIQRRPIQPRGEDALLGANPDFSIPGVGAPRGGGRSGSVGAGAGFRGGRGGMGSSSPPRNGAASAGPDGRYPTNAF